MYQNPSAASQTASLVVVGEANGASHDGQFCVDALGQQVVFVLAHFGCNTTVRVYTDASVPLQVSQLADALMKMKQAAIADFLIASKLVKPSRTATISCVDQTMPNLVPSVVFSLSAGVVRYHVKSVTDGVTCVIESSENLAPAFIIKALEAANVVYLEHVRRASA